MSVYFHPQAREQNCSQPQDIPAHQKIGTVYTEVLNAIKNGPQKSIPPLLQQLNVSQEDKVAVQTLTQLIQTLEDGTMRIVPANGGVFFVQKTEKDQEELQNVAVFKIGRKRAAMETMVRQFAHSLGLDKQMVPGMFCAVMNPPLKNDGDGEDNHEELWNGNIKLLSEEIEGPKPSEIFMDKFMENSDSIEAAYSSEVEGSGEIQESDGEDSPAKSGNSSAEKTACAIVGIIQPFLADQPMISLFDYTLLTMLAVAVGLRDAKTSGCKGVTLIDVEDCMPIRLDPIWTPEKISNSVAATDLPFLNNNPMTNQELSLEEVSKLAKIAQNWDITAILRTLSRLKIPYEDAVAERMDIGAEGRDEGGWQVSIDKPRHRHLINGDLNHLSPANNKRRLLLPNQLEACKVRLNRIKDFIISNASQGKRFTPLQLVHAVDKWSKILQEAIQRSPKLEQSCPVVRTMKLSGIHSISGKMTPKMLNITIPQEDYKDQATPSPLAARCKESINSQGSQSAQKGTDKNH